VYNSAIPDVLRPVVGQKITRVNDEGVDSGGSHRIAVSGYDEHFVPVNAELCGAHSAQAANNSEPVPPAELHVYLRISYVGGLSSNLQHTIILITNCEYKILGELKSSHHSPGRQIQGAYKLSEDFITP
jgi:hypothetical protein